MVLLPRDLEVPFLLLFWSSGFILQHASSRPFIMEDFYDARYGSIESHLDAAGFQPVSLALPSWYINRQIKVVFASRSNWDSVVSDAPLQVAPGLAEVLSSTSKPPSINFFRRLPKPPAFKVWAIYALTLEHPVLGPIIYIGSGTDAKAGVQGRHTGYRTGSGSIPKLVERDFPRR
ncbi:hypothetical protein P153DRAFT_94243 [Dothidotthia symphoricarpi CBS 119687]|uniref:Uncharacterized protein n=1 Tax=Dothidotthia symphoricarpi CBS 119687 TaxID=1392245 RepID=A0A6A6A3W1_9PLEO|nr:uncharacterized protein P153DRAFT_94243 [Dothidotthia symphoricarpi CBS 119687]KAF2125804.1 hypothetical protein P153DRAFT_94243 [Dothidotthia symphoricarpi CBS 119687]